MDLTKGDQVFVVLPVVCDSGGIEHQRYKATFLSRVSGITYAIKLEEGPLAGAIIHYVSRNPVREEQYVVL